MKNRKKLLPGLLAWLLMFTMLPMYGMEAKAEESDYIVSPYGNGVEITRYIGNNGKLIIPSQIGGKEVVRIGDYAFEGCRSLINVEIANSVTSIGCYTFLSF